MAVGVRRAIVFGVAAGLGTSVVLVAYWLSVGALEPADLRRALHSRTAAKDVFGIYLLGGLVTVGVPTTLYFRYELVSPLAVVVGLVAFWGLGDGGDAPGSLFLLAFWPAYLLVYLIVGGLELWLQGTVR